MYHSVFIIGLILGNRYVLEGLSEKMHEKGLA